MECIQLSLSGKMFPELSAQTAEKISEPCWKNLPTRHNQTFQFLDLRGGGDGARPEQSSETAGLWHGGCSTLNVGECPSVESVYTKAQTDQNISTAVDAHNSAENAHGDIRASVAAMRGSINAIELKFGTNVTKNPFSATFSSLDGLTVTGVWNAEQARVEF